MPVHDWTRVDSATFHAFHTAWVTHLSEALNGGILPSGFYAMPEQHMRLGIADILTLQQTDGEDGSARKRTGAVAVAEAQPRVSRMVELSGVRARRRTLAVRHVSNHRVVAMIEIISSANKDRPAHVEQFVEKACDALSRNVNLLLIDLFAPGPHDPQGIHFALCDYLGYTDEPPPADRPLSLAAYRADRFPTAYLEPIKVGDSLPDMPLFLDPDQYVNTPLESTYQAAYRGMPQFWRDVLEGRTARPQ